jgi:A/G-specific adenine glycosylase
MSERKKEQFRKTVYDFYTKAGRRDLPWRKTRNPYYIAVSELMLQQTQVLRVIPKYKAFIKTFPTISALAKAKFSDVLKAWSGLGYNRRAKYIHAMAKTIVAEHRGSFPKTTEELLKLPGIGPYTAQAIATFAYNKPGVCIETNIRTVYIHHFFPKEEKVSDAKLRVLIEETYDRVNPREWYWALMDYGSALKAQGNMMHRKSSSYTKQSKFEGSLRQLRGRVLKLLLDRPYTATELDTAIGEKVPSVLKGLETEGFIIKRGNRYRLK